MIIDLLKVIYAENSRMTFDGHDGSAKRWILSSSEVHVAKRRQQGYRRAIWAGIVV